MAHKEELNTIETEWWTRGFTNLFRTELGLWKNTKKWWIQIILWLMAINLLLVFVVGMPVLTPENFEDTPGSETPTITEGIFFYVVFSTFPMLAVIVLMQNVIVGEKKSGVAAWILSKPVSRGAYIASKLIGNSFGVLITMILIPGLIAYLEFSIFFPNNTISLLNFFGGLGLIFLFAMFFLTFTLMLGTIFNDTGPVTGGALGLFFGLIFFAPIIGIQNFTPLPLVSPGAADSLPLSGMVMMGETLPTLNPIIITAGFIIVFIFLAFWRFPKDEF